MGGGEGARGLLLSGAGLFAWAAQFTAIYGFTAVACARGYAGASVAGVGVVPAVIAAATAAAAVPTVLALLAGLRRRRGRDAREATARFLDDLAVLVGGISLVAILYNGLPGVILPVCR